MTLYNNSDAARPITAVEFSTAHEGTLAFLHVSTDANAAAAEQFLASSGMSVIAKTMTGGHLVIVAKGKATEQALLSGLSAQGDRFTPYVEPKHFNPWKWRGGLSVVGQGLQIGSSLTSKSTLADRAALLGFALFNLAANGVNFFFGAERNEDKNRLHLLKEQFNQTVKGQLPEDKLLSPEDNRSALRKEDTRKTAGQKLHEFLKHYSVRVGEIGLRYFGAISLVFPVLKWGKAFSDIKQGKSANAVFNTAKNDNPITFWSGVATLIGKTVTFFGKAPDPFNPKPHTSWDTVREKIAFRAGTVIELGGASAMTWDRFVKQPSRVPILPASVNQMLSGKPEPTDVIGGVGNAAFILGYAIRMFAPFGTKEVDMKELNAHISDTLATMPPEKLPQLVADIAGGLKDHFKDKKTDFATLYGEIAADLHKAHGISLMETVVAGTPVEETAPAKTFADPALRRSGPAPVARPSLMTQRLDAEAAAPRTTARA